jgi:acetylornithine deacetylase/succinyl-diaminopimelate desuccinylase-like protein
MTTAPTPPEDPRLAPVLARIEQDLPEALDRLSEFLRIPSISTDPAYKADCDTAADWLAQTLREIGIDAKKRPTSGHPMVVGHVDGPADGPHLLFYGHYDVQPVDPLELWDTTALRADGGGWPERARSFARGRRPTTRAS